jgi:hypothetical protein
MTKSEYLTSIGWTPEDESRSVAEGWYVSAYLRSVRPAFGASNRRFRSAEEVKAYVVQRADEGSELHQHALRTCIILQMTVMTMRMITADYLTKIGWTPEDGAMAASEGWYVSTYTYGVRPSYGTRNGRFKSVEAAQAYVIQRADAGSELHQRALRACVIMQMMDGQI